MHIVTLFWTKCKKYNVDVHIFFKKQFSVEIFQFNFYDKQLYVDSDWFIWV